jgi:hypothetical protein
MPASRSVASVLLRELGDFFLHPQGRPCGRQQQRSAEALAGFALSQEPMTPTAIQNSTKG